MFGPPVPTLFFTPPGGKRPCRRPCYDRTVTAPAPSYRVFARKYRPRRFDEVIGQEHIVRALSRAIAKDRIGQAYLLVGPRGVGKTTTARIIAKSMNCEQGPTAEPCLECGPCLEIERGNDLDVIEIDGASNNGVDDVRAIRDAVATRPMRDRRKIYIIDEVQRLSGQAFDALLKTLEEPPSHAMFLFATTDPHKIPDTIVSRCQMFEFRRLREVDVRAKLEYVCQAEGIEVEAEVLHAIARGCRGGMRDAESMLDQLLAGTEDRVTLDELESLAGLARPERWLALFEAVAADQPQALLGEIAAFLERGGTERDFVEQAVDALRDLLHVALLGEDALGVEPAPERRERMMALARDLGRDRLEALLGMMFQLESRMQRSPLGARALLEWTMLRASRLGQMLDLIGVMNGDVAPVARVQAAPPAPKHQAAPVPAPEPVSAPAATPEPEPEPAATPEPEPELASGAEPVTLPLLLQQLERKRPTLHATIERNFTRGELLDDGVVVHLSTPNAMDRDLLEDPVEIAALARLEGSPGPWRLAIQEAEVTKPDPVVELLLEGFDGQEELP